ncbi:Phosphate-specific transport system accessory protein PhoU [Candidatus Bealeia paramacronuclearis]|uniref:Phosphate-specific transport system accessory protein PhoU n=1 Tax=Candidatus Bealeia paramacronuclearis TaxID=1921001 RepID=A0ABZ2C4P4_9PROT|nr:Phosphate-specific transport system accessory protein PhoU [Candidatus Bealeia paramacronuclearis]
MSEHIVKAYDTELQDLDDMIVEMGEATARQIQDSIQSVITRNTELAKAVIDLDQGVDQLERKIDALAVRILALRQPVAADLRRVVAALKISNQIERIADYAANMAKRALALNDIPEVTPVYVLPRMVKIPLEMIRGVIKAYVDLDLEAAYRIWQLDEEVDEMYMSYLRELLTYMMEDPRNIGPCTHLLFIAKNIERIGDQCTNIAESIHYMVKGTPFEESHIESAS